MNYNFMSKLAKKNGVCIMDADGAKIKVHIDDITQTPMDYPKLTCSVLSTFASHPERKSSTSLDGIENVIFNDPATIIFWNDGSKTVVKCKKDEVFDPEKGLAMAIAKKALGNQGNYYNEFKKWADKYVGDSEITE